MITRPLEAATPVITTQELADFSDLDVSDVLLPVFAQTATEAVINYLQIELISRAREVIYRQWPSVGTNTSPSLSPNDCERMKEVELPFSHTSIAIDSLEINGETAAQDSIVGGKPYSLYFDSISTNCGASQNAVLCEYTTGYGTIDDVPQDIKTATMMLATYLYEHRGACDVTDAVMQSGAAMILQSYKTNLVVM